MRRLSWVCTAEHMNMAAAAMQAAAPEVRSVQNPTVVIKDETSQWGDRGSGDENPRKHLAKPRSKEKASPKMTHGGANEGARRAPPLWRNATRVHRDSGGGAAAKDRRKSSPFDYIISYCFYFC